MFGMDVLYIPRQLIQKDNVFNEEVVSQFDDSYIIEAYLENFDGFQGGGDLLTKFGIRQTDEITMVISQQRFSDLISQFLLLDQDIEVGERPQEGDLIYFPLSSNYFEIKFVEHEEPFYQLGKNYTYKLKAELFEYSDEGGEFFAGDEELIDTGYTVQYYYHVTPAASAARRRDGNCHDVFQRPRRCRRALRRGRRRFLHAQAAAQGGAARAAPGRRGGRPARSPAAAAGARA